MIKKILIFNFLFLIMLNLRLGFCGIWDLTKDAIQQCKNPANYEQVVSSLNLLTADKNIDADTLSKGTFLIGGGYIVITPESILSFAQKSDYQNGNQPEFEFFFKDINPPVEQDNVKKQDYNDLSGLTVAIDIIPSHNFFLDTLIGGLKYDQFIEHLQKMLALRLNHLGAQVSILRPSIQLNASTIDEINQQPPHIVISTQFNNDKQLNMVTFCGGNILQDDFKSDRQRARFIEAALTSKHINSAVLGACMTHRCQEILNVQPLAWEKAFFEGNALPVNVDTQFPCHSKLQKHKGKYNGIAMRNLMHNGLFSTAVVIPFPDMKWVVSEVKIGQELSWIEDYVSAMIQGLLDYLNINPSLI